MLAPVLNKLRLKALLDKRANIWSDLDPVKYSSMQYS